MKILSTIVAIIRTIPLIKEFCERLKKEIYLFKTKKAVGKVDEARTRESLKEAVIEASKKFNKK